MLNTVSGTNELYVLAYIDREGNVSNFPLGGGSSTKPSIKAYNSLASAKRGKRLFKDAVILKVKSYEEVIE